MLLSYPAYQALAGHSVNLYVLFAVVRTRRGLRDTAIRCLASDLLPTEVRFSGIAMWYNIAAAVFGGFAPLIIGSLLATTGDKASPGYFIAAVAAVALVAGLFLKRYTIREDASPIDHAQRAT